MFQGQIPNDFSPMNYILGGCMFAIGTKILAVEAKKWQGYFESVFRGLSVIIELFLRYFNHTTWRGLQLPFQNGMATFCSLKIVAAMTKIARVPFSMQKLVFFKKCCRGPPGALQNFFITKNVIPQWVTPSFDEKSCTFLFFPTKSK